MAPNHLEFSRTPTNRRATSIPMRRGRDLDQFQDDSSEAEPRDDNQNTFEFEDMSMSTTSSSSNSFTSRATSVCPHCDGLIPQEELPDHLKQHVMNNTINYAKLKELMLRRNARQGESSPPGPPDTERPSSTSSKGSIRQEHIQKVEHSNSSYNCGKCMRVFNSLFELELHDKNHVAESSLFKCQYCNKTFTKADVFEKHSKIHTGEGNPI